MSRLSVSSADLNSCRLVFFKRRRNRSHLCSFFNYSYWLNICKSLPKLKATCKETPKGYCNLPTTSNCPSVLKDADLWKADIPNMTHRYGNGMVPTGDRLSDLGSPLCHCSSVKCPSLIFIPLLDSLTSTHPTHPPVPSLLHLSSFIHPFYSHTSTGGQRTGDSVWISTGPYRSGGWLLRAERVKIVDALQHATVSCGMER